MDISKQIRDVKMVVKHKVVKPRGQTWWCRMINLEERKSEEDGRPHHGQNAEAAPDVEAGDGLAVE